MKKGYWPSIPPPYDRYVLLARLLPEVARAGMVVSPDRLIRLQRLLETLSPELPIQELGPWLSPLFATNDLQQDRFTKAIDTILQSLAETAPKVAPKAENDQPTGTKAIDRPLPQMPKDERVAEKPAERSAAYTVDIEQCTEPPYVWRIAADEEVPIAEGSEHGRTLARLRSREASDLRFLDWPTTLRATIAQAGMPALRYRARTRTVEYLLLVERFSADDHRALLFDHLYQNLRSQDVLIERYFHDGDPRHCYNERHPNGISLRELHYRHVHARLLYMGNGYRLLDHETGQPADWAKNTLLGWNTRMLLTPLARHGWGLREFQLKSLFILLPAAWEALRYAAEYPQPDQALRYTELPDYVRTAAEWPQAPIDAPYLPFLRAQLPKPLLLWTAACAVWPALHFNLTLQLGRLLSDDTYNLLQYHHLARLAALPWFANGFIPKDVRTELLEYLDTENPDTLRRCAAYLLQLLQQQFPDNPRSHAATEYTLYVAMLQTLAAPQPDEATLSRLRTVLKHLHRPAQITDFLLPRQWEVLLEQAGFADEIVPPLPDEPLVSGDKYIEAFDPFHGLISFESPPLSLLEDYSDQKAEVDRGELEANKDQIIETLLNYKIEITKIRATIGPTVTLYEIVPAPGVRISRIKNLEEDITLSLAALGIRIIAPIPGRGTIGIEVPNKNKQVVSMKEVLQHEKFRRAKMDLPIAMGKTISNEIVVADLAKMPHLLIAGATGQGKSVFINAVLMSLLYKKHPSQVKLVLIDPKKIELSLYSRLENHYLAILPGQEEPIVTETNNAIHTLNSLCIEMDTRYNLLKKADARNVREYNEKFVQRQLNPIKGHKFMPFIVLVIDEFADLIMTAGKEVELPLGRLAQLARAIGIHIIIATQRPSVNIITGVIKANFSTRIAFKVSAKVDSRTILDASGADQLIGRGDMLLSVGGDMIRVQCAFVDTPEVERVVEFINQQPGYSEPYLLPEFHGEEGEGLAGSNGPLRYSDLDEMFEDAARLIIQTQHGSTSMIQRRLKLGYNRAGRLMDQLESAGIVGAADGSKAREVLIYDEMELNRFLDDLKRR